MSQCVEVPLYMHTVLYVHVHCNAYKSETVCSISADEDNNSNSSNDSDQLHSASGSGYHRGTQSDSTGTIKTSAPVCRHESISIAAMEDCPTDIDNEVCVCVFQTLTTQYNL